MAVANILIHECLSTAERKMMYVSDMGIDETELYVDFASFDDPIWSTKFDNALLGNTVSSKVKLECNSEWGRHWIAVEDIEAGITYLLHYSYTVVEKIMIKFSDLRNYLYLVYTFLCCHRYFHSVYPKCESLCDCGGRAQRPKLETNGLAKGKSNWGTCDL